MSTCILQKDQILQSNIERSIVSLYGRLTSLCQLFIFLLIGSSFEESLRSITYEKKHALVADVVGLHGRP